MVGIGTRLGLNRIIAGVHGKILETENANLIGYWPLWETPASQEYLTFDGADTIVNCGSDASLDDLADAAITVDGWIRPVSSGESSAGRIMMKGGTFNTGWEMWVGSGALYGRIHCATTNAQTNTTGIDVIDGEWHHVAMTFDDAGDRKVYLYVDGVAVNQSQTAGVEAIESDAANDLNIGNVSGSGRTFDGDIGWVRVSNHERWSSGFSAPSRTTIPSVDANTMGLWPLNEGYGSVAWDMSGNNNDGTITDGDWGAYPAADNFEGTAARDGEYIGVTLGQLVSPFVALLFDGVNDYVDIYSASLAGAFNGDAGTALIFAKVSAGVWTDGTARSLINLSADGDNGVKIRKAAGAEDDVIYLTYEAGGTSNICGKTGMSETGWMMWAITWDRVADQVKAYYNGAQEGPTKTGLGVWTGSLGTNITTIASSNHTPNEPFDGYLAHCAIWTKALTAAQILAIYTAAGVA